MLKLRVLIAALLAFWLVLGPAAGAWASGGGASCESMISTPAEDCCGGGGAAVTSCAGVCAAASLGIAFVTPELQRIDGGSGALPSRHTRYASHAAPPDIAPPKASFS